MKLILKAIGYTIAILGEAFSFTIIVLVVTHSGSLAVLIFPASIFLGILAVFTDELKKREALLMRRSHEKIAMTSPSYASELTWNTLRTDQVSTTTVVDLQFGKFDLHLAIHTDVERSRCVLSQYSSVYPPTNQITQNTQV